MSCLSFIYKTSSVFINEKTIWTKDEVFKESKKYASRLEFAKKSNGAYTKALKNNWLDDMAWLIPKGNKINIQS